ncbi:MAG TPA: MmgE/PrpD family protein [Pseudonocardiaceae bacterium]|nr:MmgE/PrpD family protein [Pseudonocardiaceae bacterium]
MGGRAGGGRCPVTGVLDELTGAAVATDFGALPPEVATRLTLLLADAVGCALAGVTDPTARRVAGLAASRFGTPTGVTALGVGTPVTPDMAAFVNGTALRALELNDTYLGGEPVHPSDTVSAVLAAGELAGASGATVLAGMAVAYETLCRLCANAAIRERGWDTVTFGALATALGAGRVLGLDRDRLRDAVTVATVSAPALWQTRVGELSAWKTSAFADAARNGLFAALVAQTGIGGPPQAIDGPSGLERVVTGRLDLPDAAEWQTMRVRAKMFAAQYFTHPAIEACLRLRETGLPAGSIRAVAVRTFGMAVTTAGTDRDKWAPANRETADHSLPYCAAVALLDGEVTPAQFTDARLAADDVRALLPLVTVAEDPEATAGYPDTMATTVEVTLDGETRSASVTRPLGDPRRGLTEADVAAKFLRCATASGLDHHATRRVLDLCLGVTGLDDIGVLLHAARDAAVPA